MQKWQMRALALTLWNIWFSFDTFRIIRIAWNDIAESHVTVIRSVSIDLNSSAKLNFSNEVQTSIDYILYHNAFRCLYSVGRIAFGMNTAGWDFSRNQNLPHTWNIVWGRGVVNLMLFRMELKGVLQMLSTDLLGANTNFVGVFYMLDNQFCRVFIFLLFHGSNDGSVFVLCLFCSSR